MPADLNSRSFEGGPREDAVACRTRGGINDVNPLTCFFVHERECVVNPLLPTAPDVEPPADNSSGPPDTHAIDAIEKPHTPKPMVQSPRSKYDLWREFAVWNTHASMDNLEGLRHKWDEPRDPAAGRPNSSANLAGDPPPRAT